MTRLMNLDLECPNDFFIFCKCNKPITAHNLTIPKRFESAAFTNCSITDEFLKKYENGTATYLPFLPAKHDCDISSPYCVTAINDYRIEMTTNVRSVGNLFS